MKLGLTAALVLLGLAMANARPQAETGAVAAAQAEPVAVDASEKASKCRKKNQFCEVGSNCCSGFCYGGFGGGFCS